MADDVSVPLSALIEYSEGDGPGGPNPPWWSCNLCHEQWETRRDEPEAHAEWCALRSAAPTQPAVVGPQDEIAALRARNEALETALNWIAQFAAIRSEDDSKTFARVNRGALRNIAERARKTLSGSAGAGDGGWQPIETTPRDGTRVLFWDARRELAVSGCWHSDPGRDDPGGYEPAWAWWTADDDLIMWDGGPDDTPTYWRPFEPPRTTTGGQNGR